MKCDVEELRPKLEAKKSSSRSLHLVRSCWDCDSWWTVPVNPLPNLCEYLAATLLASDHHTSSLNTCCYTRYHCCCTVGVGRGRAHASRLQISEVKGLINPKCPMLDHPGENKNQRQTHQKVSLQRTTGLSGCERIVISAFSCTTPH